MEQAVSFLIRHGVWVIFGSALAEQLGLPVPAAPVLLAGGALMAAQKIPIFFGVIAAVLGAWLGDIGWYSLGRLRGRQVLMKLCSLAVEPTSCIAMTERIYRRYGMPALFASKFVPGMGVVMRPLAAIVGVGAWRFSILDALAILIHASVFIGAGWLFRTELERLAIGAGRMGHTALVALAVAGVLFILFKWWRRLRDRSRLAPVVEEKEIL